METWRLESTEGGKNLLEAKIQRGIFQRDTLLPLLSVIAIMPLNYTLRKWTGGYKSTKWQGNINHLTHMDDI